jgi:SAM-dependent methyltransferase
MASLIQLFLLRANRLHSVHSYNALIARNRRKFRQNEDMAMIASIGDVSRQEFERQGDAHVAVLRHHGLDDGMTVYDLGCGCGRTAMALQRNGWRGAYKGADIAKPLINYLKANCPGYEAMVHRDNTIAAPDTSLDMIFHWSVFTHLYPEECFLYMEDSFRALKPGAKLIFSFLEFEEAKHHGIFASQVRQFRKRGWSATLDVFLHRDWIRLWARQIGFEDITFTDGTDGTHHPEFWQALVAMRKPN